MTKKPIDRKLVKIILTIRSNCFVFGQLRVERYKYTPLEIQSLVKRMTARDYHPTERDVDRHLAEMGFPYEVHPDGKIFYDLQLEPKKV